MQIPCGGVMIYTRSDDDQSKVFATVGVYALGR